MSKTVVGLFNSVAAAQQVKQALVADGYESRDINVVADNQDDNQFGNDFGNLTDTTGSATNTAASRTSTGSSSTGTGTGVGQKISNFFHSLTGGDERDRDYYSSGVQGGGAVLTVVADDDDANDVANLLKQHGARDIDGGYQGAADLGTPVYGSSTASDRTGETTIPVVEEELVVGKREVDRGGVRIYSHVVERPVETDVTLRDERINVERRPVDRAATTADFDAGKEASFEVRASGEEAVVGKSSRVVEEILVGKEASERTEAIKDTVRKTEVEVENLPGDVTTRSNRS